MHFFKVILKNFQKPLNKIKSVNLHFIFKDSYGSSETVYSKRYTRFFTH